MLTFSEENYLKSIFHLSSDSELGVSTNSIADNLNTKASSVTEMLKKLGEKNLIVYKKPPLFSGGFLFSLINNLPIKIICLI